MSYRVACPDGRVRHDGDFVHLADALTFAEWGHFCLAADAHTITGTVHRAPVGDRR